MYMLIKNNIFSPRKRHDFAEDGGYLVICVK